MDKSKLRQNQSALVDWLEVRNLSPADSIAVALSVAGMLIGLLVRNTADPDEALAEGVRLATDVLTETGTFAKSYLDRSGNPSGEPEPVAAPPKTFSI